MPKLYSDHSFRRHLVVLPDDFDQWFTVNRFIPDADGVICQTGDVPSDKVVCTLQLSRVMVWRHYNSAAFCQEVTALSNRPILQITFSHTACCCMSRFK